MASEVKKWSESCSVVSDSLRPHVLQPARLLCPWISQARILEWVAVPFSRGSSQPRNQVQVSCIGKQTLYHLSHQGSLMALEEDRSQLRTRAWDRWSLGQLTNVCLQRFQKLQTGVKIQHYFSFIGGQREKKPEVVLGWGQKDIWWPLHTKLRPISVHCDFWKKAHILSLCAVSGSTWYYLEQGLANSDLPLVFVWSMS